MLKVWKKRYTPRQRLGHVTVAGVVAAILVCLPWYSVFRTARETVVLGLDLSYFLVLFAVPVLLGGLALVHGREADDQERYIRKFENE